MSNFCVDDDHLPQKTGGKPSPRRSGQDTVVMWAHKQQWSRKSKPGNELEYTLLVKIISGVTKNFGRMRGKRAVLGVNMRNDRSGTTLVRTLENESRMTVIQCFAPFSLWMREDICTSLHSLGRQASEKRNANCPEQWKTSLEQPKHGLRNK